MKPEPNVREWECNALRSTRSARSNFLSATLNKVRFKALAFFCIGSLALAAPNPEAHDAGNSSINTPQMFGAIGDGARHPISKTDLDAHAGKWVGTYVVRDEWDYVGIQEAIYAAFYNGTLTPNGSNQKLNKPLHIPRGYYLVNKTPTVVALQGGYIYGDGRETTTIASTFAGSAFRTNGCCYSQFTGIQFACTVATTVEAAFELDGNYNGSTTQGVQANTFKDCLFHGGYAANKCFSLVRQGGNGAQGSENLFLNCHFTGAAPKGYGFWCSGGNAVQNTILGGNVQDCTHGIYILVGSVNVDSVGFQNGFVSQVDWGGYDVEIWNSSDDHSSVRNCRTESAKMLYVGNNHYVVFENNNMLGGAPYYWQATHAYTHGQVIYAPTGAGHYFICIIGGTTGSSEPTWNYYSENYTKGTTTAGNKVLTAGTGNDFNSGMWVAGNAIEVVGAGASGGNLYTTISSHTDSTHVVMATNASTAVTDARCLASAGTADGTVKWIDFRYYEVYAPLAVGFFNGNTFKFGYVNIGPGGAVVNNTFARGDGDGFDPSAPEICFGNVVTLNGGPNTGSAAVQLQARTKSALTSKYEKWGSGSPEGVVTADKGSVYHRTDGGAGTSFYVKESGTGNTGWVGK
ncbi:MAG: hypothetical protein DME75_09605 [Verrucomicrobia bacterium]|nr:MAG: hypothetical protein DME75_09605 [Verrucomicrobiota bacterium]